MVKKVSKQSDDARGYVHIKALFFDRVKQIDRIIHVSCLSCKSLSKKI